MPPNRPQAYCGKAATIADKINENVALHNLVRCETVLVRHSRLRALHLRNSVSFYRHFRVSSEVAWSISLA